ncbi:MAG: helix-turn-helix domain-containing protein [Aeromicrobium sp.]
MAQSSNPTRRVVEVLNFLARDGLTYSLTEMGRELAISKATLHAVVGTLLDSGYLVRDPRDRRIGLGPMLIPVGRAALGDRSELIEALRPTMQKLAADHDAHCSASAAVGDTIVVLAAEGDPSTVRTPFLEGERGLPFEPPIGSLFVAWSDPGRIQEWIDKGSADPLETALHLSALEQIRAHGYAVAERLDAKLQLDSALAQFATNSSAREPREAINILLSRVRSQASTYLIVDYDDEHEHDVDWIGVPVFGRDHEVDMVLAVLNFPAALSGRQIADIADQLMEAVAAVRPTSSGIR